MIELSDALEELRTQHDYLVALLSNKNSPAQQLAILEKLQTIRDRYKATIMNRHRNS